MKERPILFSGPMVRAILDGRKTQTRRVVKDINPTLLDSHPTGDQIANLLRCPYGVPEDQLWVRERWRASGIFNDERTPDLTKRVNQGSISIHMPRWASRITLEVTQVRVERVQDITEEDAASEGCTESRWESETADTSSGSNVNVLSAKGSFRKLWDSRNAERGFGWDVNPWVWVVSFEVVKWRR